MTYMERSTKMSSCNTPIDAFQAEDGSLDVSSRYKQLMQDTLSEDSLYIRAKDTMYANFDKLNLTAEEKAKLVSEHVAMMTSQLSGAAMQTALQWEKEERDGAYTLAKVKAETENAIAQSELIAEQVCQAQKQTELICAQITATVSGTFRENGMPTGYTADGCTPTGLDDTGLKYHQTKQVEAATYQSYADAFRKSGVVKIGADTTNNNMMKGLSGDDDGFTNQQAKNAERQRIGFEDSKRNHAANSAAAMIGQLLSSETLSVNNQQDIDRWRESIDYLNDSHSSTSEL